MAKGVKKARVTVSFEVEYDGKKPSAKKLAGYLLAGVSDHDGILVDPVYRAFEHTDTRILFVYADPEPEDHKGFKVVVERAS